ncbi:hypothetical protein PISMIDRAFT_18724 [Pisolithus microcarpus 441]|uniref:Uncharacterized protein n=1 Tax=Pisolithus microcarpus 441 TaxID=765257 RepID=A0A0C9Y687_9AGAM|nr:hypothetical protein PISMIDRAFT_18724 [Pisolithus microcarpus 441]
MLCHALDLRKDIDWFIWHISLQEHDADKHHKIMELELTDTKWECVQHLL